MKLLHIIAVLLILTCLNTYSAEITIRWTMPTVDINGTQITDLGGAKIYWGLNSSNYTRVADAGLTNTFTITNLTEGVLYYVNGTAYNIYGLESAFTDEVAKNALETIIGKPRKPIYLNIK